MDRISSALISLGSTNLLPPGYTATSSSSVLTPESAKVIIEVGSDVDENINVLEVENVDEDNAVIEEDHGDEDIAHQAKRAKVRYLGSHLVLGLNERWEYEPGLPEVRYEDKQGGAAGLIGRKEILAAHQAHISNFLFVRTSTLTFSSLPQVSECKEKAKAVRRKAKMEKMFGERRPQKLYQPHTGRYNTIVLGDLSEEEWEELEGGEHYKSYRASFNSLAYFVSNADRDLLEGLFNIVSSTSPLEKGDADKLRVTPERNSLRLDENGR